MSSHEIIYEQWYVEIILIIMTVANGQSYEEVGSKHHGSNRRMVIHWL